MSINIYSTQTMLQAINKMKPVRTFLRDTFFPKVETFVTEDVMVDFKKGKRKMAPFVAPRIGGLTMDRNGFRTDKYTAPRICPQRVLTKDDLNGRGFGENVFSTRTPAQRQQEILGSDLAELDEMITRREEWMVRELLINGKITMIGYIDKVGGSEYVEQEIDYTLTNKDTLTGDDKWDTTTSTPYEDLKAWRLTVMQSSGVAPTELIVAHDVLEHFLAHADIIAKMDNRRYELGIIQPRVELGGALTYIGTLTELGLDIWTYDEWFISDAGVETAMIPDGHVIMARPGMGRRLYGAVTQMENDQNFYTYEGARVPKVWADVMNEVKMVRISSRPVPAPFDIDDWYVAVVL